MASPNISFDQIPASIRKPGKYFEFNTKLAVRTLPANAQRVLIVGQRLAAGSVPALVPTQVFSDAEAAAYFGQGSMLHRMVRAAIKAYPYIDITCLALDDAAAGAQASSQLSLSGKSTSSGTFSLWMGKELVQVAVPANYSAGFVMTSLASLLAKLPDSPAWISSVSEQSDSEGFSAAQGTVTAKHKGTLGNSIKLACTSVPGITATVQAMSGGAVDPGLAAALAVVAGAGHTIVITPYADQTGLLALRDHLDFCGGPLEQRGARGVYALAGTLASATTCAGQVNAGRITGALLRGARALSWEIAAAYGAVLASEEDPARPLNYLALAGIDAPDVADRLTRTEQEVCLHNGVTPLEVGPDGTTVRIVRAISTYTVDPQGIQDIALLDITTIATLDYVRKAIRERVSLRFPREKLSSRTPAKVRSEILDVLYKLEELEIVENVAANADGVIVERDSQDPNRLDAKIPVDIVNGLHVFAGRIDLLL